jgi:hypothetical protein
MAKKKKEKIKKLAQKAEEAAKKYKYTLGHDDDNPDDQERKKGDVPPLSLWRL